MNRSTRFISPHAVLCEYPNEIPFNVSFMGPAGHPAGDQVHQWVLLWKFYLLIIGALAATRPSLRGGSHRSLVVEQERNLPYWSALIPLFHLLLAQLIGLFFVDRIDFYAWYYRAVFIPLRGKTN